MCITYVQIQRLQRLNKVTYDTQKEEEKKFNMLERTWRNSRRTTDAETGL